jgi:hypothetical protein
MSNETIQKRYMLILRGGKSDKNLSPSEYGQVIQKYLTWIEGLRNRGHYEAGEPLEEEGKLLSTADGSILTDTAPLPNLKRR